MNIMDGSTNNSSQTCDLRLSSAIAMATVNSFFAILGVIGNILVYLAVYKTPDLQTYANAYLVILAGADFITSSIAQPLLIAMVVKEGNGECDETLTTAFRVIGNFSCAASFLILCSITTERLLAVVKPIAYKSFHPKRRFVILTSISLILPLIYTVLRVAVSKKVTSFLSGALFIIGYIYIILCYLGILLKLRRQSNRMATSTTNEDSTLRRQAEKAVSSTMAIVVAIFTLMWIPFFYYRISKPSTNSGVGYNWVRTIAISNSALNPILYALRMDKFRIGFKQVIGDGLHSIFSSRAQTFSTTS